MKAFLLRSLNRIAMILACLFVMQSAAFAALPLRILAWEGYADADVVKNFSRKYQVPVEVTIVTSDDELWERINKNQGRDYDIFAVNTAELSRYIQSNLVQPVTTDRITNLKYQHAIFSPLSKVSGLMRDGQIYAIPYTYSTMGLIYNRDLVKSTPDSMQAMWDTQYQGKVLFYDGSAHNFSIAALSSGLNHPFQLDHTEIRAMAKKLVDLRRNSLTFYQSVEDAVKLFKENKVALIYGNYGTQQLKALRDTGANVGYIIPKEGALAWLDCWAITRATHQARLAETWINFTLEKMPSDVLAQRHGLSNTTEVDLIKPDRSGRIIWLEPVESPETRQLLWERIMAGDRLERF